MHKFAKILPESECGSRLRMVRWYYQTRFENGLMQKKADCGSRKSGSSQDCGIKKRKGGWKRSETGGKNGNEQSNGSNGWYEKMCYQQQSIRCSSVWSEAGLPVYARQSRQRAGEFRRF